MSAKPYGIIYRITNLVNQKIYIGQTTRRLTHRWQQHCCETKCSKVTRAIRKYGPAAFRIEQIAQAESLERLNELEAYWIFTLQSHLPQFGYNLRLGGTGAPYNEEARAKNSAARKRYYAKHPEALAKLSAGQKRYFAEHPEAWEANRRALATPEVRAKLRAAGQRRFADPEECAKAAEYFQKYREANPQHGAEHSEWMKRYHAEHPEMRAQLSAVHKQRLGTPEGRAKRSAEAKRQYENPEARAKASAAAKRRFADPEQRAKSAARFQQYREQNPEQGAEHSAWLKRHHAENPQQGAEHSAWMKRYYTEHPEKAARQVAAMNAGAKRRRKEIALLKSQIAQMNWS